MPTPAVIAITTLMAMSTPTIFALSGMDNRTGTASSDVDRKTAKRVPTDMPRFTYYAVRRIGYILLDNP